MTDRIAVVTGARRGLGLGTAQALAREAYRVVVTARTAERAAEGAAEVEGAEARAMDVADDASVAAFFRWLGETHGRIDALVNNAGANFQLPPEGPTGAAVLEAVDNNAVSAWRTGTLALPLMNAAGFGRIVNVSSGMGMLRDMGGGFAPYRISKTAMNAVTRILHADAGPGVKVNSVCPGWVRTDMGGPSATRALEEGVASIVWAALLPDDGPSGGFFRDGKPLDW